MNRKSFLQKLGVFSGATAAFSLFSKIPVHAAVLDNTKVRAKDVSYQDTDVDASLTELNNSLNNIDIRYTTTNGAEWSPRGADSWSPFSSLNGALWNGSSISVVENGHFYNDGGAYPSSSGLASYINEHSTIMSAVKSGYYCTFTFLKEGYYIWVNAYNSGPVIPTHYNVGDTITILIISGNGDNHGQSSCIMYLGASDPTQ